MVDSLLMALVLFFSSYMQYWWNGAANFFNPWFPWIVLAPLWRCHLPPGSCCSTGCSSRGCSRYFYPPNAISLGFVAVVMWLVIRPDWLQWGKAVASP